MNSITAYITVVVVFVVDTLISSAGISRLRCSIKAILRGFGCLRRRRRRRRRRRFRDRSVE